MTEDSPLFILAGNGPYENRGCEAIVRGTTSILRKCFRNPHFICHTHFQSESQYRKQRDAEQDNGIQHLSSQLLTRDTVLKRIYRRQTWEEAYRYFRYPNSRMSWLYKQMLPHIEDSTAVLSVGGDNYSLDYGIPTLFTGLDGIILERGKPLVIWGASVGPFSAQPEYEQYMGCHLQEITGIFARESATVEYLEKIGVSRNVFPVADPAFLMDPVKPAAIDEEMFIDEDSIGLNLSPLMAKYVTAGDIEKWEKIAASIIESIARTIELPIYLIPHVTIEGSDDHAFMQRAMSHISRDCGKITLIPPCYNAAETKWIISQVGLFAGARTHATIAAFSSCIPTLSFGYSLKARGINRDIFGHSHFCLDPHELDASIVSKKIASIREKTSEVQLELRKEIPNIEKSALQAGFELNRLVVEG